ncbi:MAG: Ni/Fe-hydrogenase cytochrome b subunit [Alphaproteobacteria bacterium]|nr:Ni/Fe-hydrogenase cytochrome b subunit [Alphaproteobacteria bacterium]
MATAAHQPLARRIFTPTMIVLAALVAVAAYFVATRFMYGLGAVTNLNQGYPWGMWVVVDIVIGTAFGCGGFAMALLVYIFNRNQYHRLMRPALLGGLFGYTLAGVAVMIDLGRYWQFYNLLLPWYAQPSSVMFEVALCVLAYVIVLWIEFSPAFLERFGLYKVRDFLRRFMFLFIALGVLLPTMHQSSLGSLLLVMGSQLSPLWYTTWLPLMFLVTALAMGYAVVMFEATVVSNTFNLPSEQPILAKLSIMVGWMMAGFLLFRFAELALRGDLVHAFAGDLNALMFWIETALFLLPVAIFLTPGGRESQRLMFLGAVALLVAGSLYRLDAYLVAYTPVQNYTYFPSVPELMVTVGVVALEILLYLLFVKTLPVLHAHEPARTPKAR